MSERKIELDISACWKDALALLRANMEVVVILSGLFLFLPNLISTLIAGEPGIRQGDTLSEIQAALFAWMQTNAPYLIISSLLSIYGTLAIMFMAINPAKPTVGDALRMAGSVLLFYSIAHILSNIVIGAALLLLIIPAIYVAVKLSLSAAVAAAENERNPLTMLTRSWKLTKGNSLMLFVLLLMVIVAGFLVMLVSSLVFSIGFNLILSQDTAKLGVTFIDTALQTAFGVLLIHIYMAAYRQLSAGFGGTGDFAKD